MKSCLRLKKTCFLTNVLENTLIELVKKFMLFLTKRKIYLWPVAEIASSYHSETFWTSSSQWKPKITLEWWTKILWSSQDHGDDKIVNIYEDYRKPNNELCETLPVIGTEACIFNSPRYLDTHSVKVLSPRPDFPYPIRP